MMWQLWLCQSSSCSTTTMLLKHLLPLLLLSTIIWLSGVGDPCQKHSTALLGVFWLPFHMVCSLHLVGAFLHLFMIDSWEGESKLASDGFKPHFKSFQGVSSFISLEIGCLAILATFLIIIIGLLGNTTPMVAHNRVAFVLESQLLFQGLSSIFCVLIHLFSMIYGNLIQDILLLVPKQVSKTLPTIAKVSILL